MRMSSEVNEIAGALSKAQSIMKSCKEDSTNPMFKKPHATIDGMLEVSRPALNSNDISLCQECMNNEIGVYCETTLFHKSGQYLVFSSPTVPLTKKDAHGVGAATTYARKLSLKCAVGLLCGEMDTSPHDKDDDGNCLVVEPTKSTETKGDPLAEIISLVRILDDDEHIDQLLKFVKSPSLDELKPVDYGRVISNLTKKIDDKEKLK